MAERNKWIVLVTELLRATQQMEIRWKRVEPGWVGGPDEQVAQAYEASFRGKKFRLYKFAREVLEPGVSGLERMWDRGVKLEFIGERGEPLFEVPRVAGVSDLLNAAAYQTADIDEFLNSLAKSPA
jgi:hypothetical protein